MSRFSQQKRVPRVALVGLLIATLTGSGCYTHMIIPKAELSKLDGFRAGDVRYLADIHRRRVTFTVDTPITILGNRGERFGARYILIDVDSESFRGVTVGGDDFTVALDDISRLRIVVLRSGKTVAVLGAVLLGVTLMAVSVS